MDCGTKTIQIFLFIFNFLFSICGLALGITGIVVISAYKEYVSVLGETFNVLPIIIIVIGFIIFFIAFFGCIGAYKLNHCMVLTFACLMGILLILELGAAIAAFQLRGQVHNYFKTGFGHMIDSHHEKNRYSPVNLIQHNFECCGSNNYTDWDGNAPSSCCIQDKCNSQNPAEIHKIGCVETFTEWFKSKIVVIGGIALAIAFVEILGIIFGCCLSKSIQSSYEKV